MSNKKNFRRLCSEFRFSNHITVCRDSLLGCPGWCSGAAMPLQNLMCVVQDESTEWAPKSSFGGFPANFDFQDISQYVETYFWAVEGVAVGLQCFCRTWCVLLQTNPQYEHKKFFWRLSSEFRFSRHMRVWTDLFLGCGGWSSAAAMSLQMRMCVLKTCLQNEHQKKRLLALQRILIFKSYHSM